ncbi:concanavalin A-like lectin/glucanase domain-containing protein [Powellomyces hirtus]|nr:concanavalin A-like lectin/glucanase domain-containing protein [Powellomyces hirtus]
MVYMPAVLVATLACASLVTAVPTAEWLTGKWDKQIAGQYMLSNNLWGADTPGTEGTQRSQVRSVSANGKEISWATEYDWNGIAWQVKSFANVELNAAPRQIKDIKALPTDWTWSLENPSSSLVMDVSYDLWFSPHKDGTGASPSASLEVMVWLSTYGGSGPAGEQVGQATIAGETWRIWKGLVSTWNVISFIPLNEKRQLSMDLKPFIDHVVDRMEISKKEYLVSSQAGTEPFMGSARMVTSKYSLSVE